MDKYGIQIELLKEIDALCRVNGLTYILYKDIARIASENDPARYNSIVVNIAMTRGEALKLRELIYAQDRQDRFIEGIEDNENYLRWSFIYGDVNTTDFNLVKTKNQANKGIHINIDFIEKVHSKVNHGKIKAYRKLRKLTCINEDDWSLWYAKAAARITPILGKERIMKKYVSVRSSNDIEKWQDIRNYEVVSINNRNVSTTLLNEIKEIELCGTKFIVPSKLEKYLEDTGTRTIEEIKKAKASSRRMTSTVIGYKEVMEDPRVLSIMKEANEHYEVIVDKKKKNKKAQSKIEELVKLVTKIVNDTEA